MDLTSLSDTQIGAIFLALTIAGLLSLRLLRGTAHAQSVAREPPVEKSAPDIQVVRTHAGPPRGPTHPESRTNNRAGSFGATRRPVESFPSAAVHDSYYGTSNVAKQLDAVMAGTFKKKRLMNQSEYGVFAVVERTLANIQKGYRLFAQTSLGEVLESADAHHTINAKRVDMLIVDRSGWPVLAIEYQGAGHHQGNAAARDAIKKEALRRAGVPYLEITPDDNDARIGTRVREMLGCDVVSGAGSPKVFPPLAAVR